MSRQGVLVAADLARQVGQLEVGLRQGPPRGDVGLLPQQGAELAVEVRGRFQEPVAQLLEFLLLEQEVLTHAGVKRLDCVRRSLYRASTAARDLVSRPLASFRAVFALVSLVSDAASLALAAVCTAATAAKPPRSDSSTRLAANTPVRCLRTYFFVR